MEPIISIVICTHNRSNYLNKSIGSLVNQDINRDLYEILVVDNLSTDSTKEVVENFSNIVNVSYFYEPNLGLSHARNTGWKNAKAKYVGYLDDDAIASENWISKIIEVYETVKPTPSCVGGRINPIWESPKPAWLNSWLLHALSIIDWTDRAHFITNLKEEWLAGTNMAFEKEIIKKMGGFINGLGRVGNNLLSNEDLYIQRQLINAGYKCYYDPEISVSHHVIKSRINKKWFIKRYFWQGVSDAAEFTLENSPSFKEKISCAITTLKIIKELQINLLKRYFEKDYPERFRDTCLILVKLGYIAGLLFLYRT